MSRSRPNLRESVWDLLDGGPFAYLGFYTDRSLFFYNHAAQQLFGYPPGEVQHLEAWVQRVSQEREARVQFSRLWLQGFAGEIPTPAELSLQLQEGRRKVRLGLVPLRADGAVVGALAWAQPLGRGRSKGEQRSFEQQRANLLALVSHEFRAPLVSIRGYNELILHERLGPITEQQRRGLEIALRNVGHLAELIDNLLIRSRLELGGFLSRPQRFDLAECLREVATSFQPQVDERQLTAKIQLAAPLWCVGDRQSLYRAFTNLLANAIKFTEAKGTIELRAVQVGTELRVSIQDSGIGIAPGELARIFEPFYQVESAMTRRFRGAGLGLALVKDVIQQHRGRIEVESALGAGSCFTVHLPAAGGGA